MTGDERQLLRPGVLGVLPRLIALAPPRVLLVVGVLVVLLGALIVSRPLTSLVLLGVYVGVSAIVMGALEAARSERRWTRVVGVLWIAGGVAVLIWLGRSLELLPPTLAVLLILGGVASLAGVASGSAGERALALAWAATQVIFGVLSLTWPDVTLLVVAVVFGIRTIVWGVTLVTRSIRALFAGAHGGKAEQSHPRRARVLEAARWALAALLVVTCIGGWALNDWLAAGAPVVDAFYDAPADVPSEHGVLIRSAAYHGQAPKGGEVRRILYTTQDAHGLPAVGSALVISPTEPAPGPAKVVVWDHGTTGVARGCAPSLGDKAATKWSIPGIEEALARGWVIIAPDLAGQGTEGVFPYLIGRGEAYSTLDAVQAARYLDDLVLSTDVAIWGHSQGGHSALWAAQEAASYAPWMNVVGTAAIAPAGDPLALAGKLARGGSNAELSILISWVLVPYADTYPDVNIADYVSPAARTIVREMTQRCLSEPGVMVSAATALGVSEDSPLYPADLTTGPLGRRLGKNIPTGPWPSPLLVAWGRDDDVIPPSAQEAFVTNLCGDGAELRKKSYDGVGHQNVLHPGSPLVHEVVRWTQGMFSGTVGFVPDCAP